MTQESESGDAQQAEGSQNEPAIPAPQWAPQQLLRLQHEWRRLQRDTAFHPHVKVTPVQGMPPHEFEIEYVLRTLMTTEEGQLDYATSVSVHLSLPAQFPYEAPLARPLTNVFHPNVSPDGIVLIPPWEPNGSLSDLVFNIGRLLAFQVYDPHVVLDPAAMDWTQQNFALLPLHADAELTPDAGGGALGRICKFGSRTLSNLQDQVTQVYDHLLAVDAQPEVDQIQLFASRMRMSLDLLLEPDVPENLRDPAIEMEEWARELPASLPAWDTIRRLRNSARFLVKTTDQLAAIHRQLAIRLQAVSALCTQSPSANASEAIRQLPTVDAVTELRGVTQRLVVQAQELLQAIETETSHIDSAPAARITVRPEGTLAVRLREEMAKDTEEVAAARNKTRTLLATVVPALESATRELALLDRVVYYREYADLLDETLALVQQIRQWGPAGLEAYFVATDDGNYGPFEFERGIQFGAFHIAVRDRGRNSIGVIDANTGLTYDRGDEGEVKLQLVDPETSQPLAITFGLTGMCDELQHRLYHLNTRLRKHLHMPVPNLPKSDSWAGQFIAALDAGTLRLELLSSQEAFSAECSGILADLGEIAMFKSRLAAHFLIERMERTVPEFLKDKSDAKATVAEASVRIEEIVRKSTRNPETGQLIVPAQFAKEYPQLMRTREKANRQIRRAEELIRLMIERLTRRLSTPRLFGTAKLLNLRVLGPMPEEYTGLAPVLSDGRIIGRVLLLEEMLGRTLRPPELQHIQPETPEGVPLQEAPPADVDPDAAPPAPAETAVEDKVEFVEESPAEDTEVYAEPAAEGPVEGQFIMDDSEPQVEEGEQMIFLDGVQPDVGSRKA